MSWVIVLGETWIGWNVILGETLLGETLLGELLPHRFELCRSDKQTEITTLYIFQMSYAPEHCWYLERIGIAELPNYILQNSKVGYSVVISQRTLFFVDHVILRNLWDPFPFALVFHNPQGPNSAQIWSLLFIFLQSAHLERYGRSGGSTITEKKILTINTI